MEIRRKITIDLSEEDCEILNKAAGVLDKLADTLANEGLLSDFYDYLCTYTDCINNVEDLSNDLCILASENSIILRD